MAAGRYTLVVEQGATLSKVFCFKRADGTPLDLTGWSASAAIRESFDGPVVAALTCAVAEPATDGKVIVTLSANDSAALTQSGTLHWDLITRAGDVVRRRVEGAVEVRRRVTDDGAAYNPPGRLSGFQIQPDGTVKLFVNGEEVQHWT